MEYRAMKKGGGVYTKLYYNFRVTRYHNYCEQDFPKLNLYFAKNLFFCQKVEITGSY